MAVVWQDRIVGLTREDPTQLLAHPFNARLHPKPQQDALAGAIRDLGYLVPVIVNDATGHTLDGHLRIEQAISEGQPTIPVIHVDLPEALEAEALLTLDPIAAMAALDRANLDALLRQVEGEDAAVRQLLAEMAEREGLAFGATEPPEDPGADLDRAEELRAQWGTERGQLWEIGPHRLLCGDATDAGEVARALCGAPVGCLVIDPPWDAGLFSALARAPSTLVFADARRCGEAVSAFGPPTWLFVWDCGSCWYAPNRPLQRLKLCLWYGDLAAFNAEGAFYGAPLGSNSKQRGRFGTYAFAGDPRGLHLADVYQQGIGAVHADGLHRHEKPVDWMRLLIGDCSTGLVVDPFAGAGTSLVAAQQLGRAATGIERDPGYVAVTLERLAGMGLAPRVLSRDVVG
ncbi:MAG TPA: DNA methyltransferase [Dehalococcoidia bacterium]|nr:DNA methyltransferase [Dehalococcoidia bacterium]